MITLKKGEFGIFLFGNTYFGTRIAERIALCWEVIMKRIDVETGISQKHRENARSINFFKKLGANLIIVMEIFYFFSTRLQKEERHWKK